MKDYRGTIIQFGIILALTLLALRSNDPYVIHSVVAILGTSAGHALTRARYDSNGGNVPPGTPPGAMSGGGTYSISPIMGGIIMGLIFLEASFVYQAIKV